MPPKANPAASRAEQSSGQGRSTATGNGESSPGRPPVQRLQSLNKRTPGAGLMSSNRAAIGLDDPNKPKPALKFQPRAQSRRTKEEREAILKVEEERNRQRLEEAAAIQRSRLGPVRKTRGAAFRGRGGAGVAGGGGAVGLRGGLRGSMNNSRASSMSRHSMPVLGDGDPDYSSDEDTGGIRTSIDHINLDRDEDGEEDAKGKKAMRPSYNKGPMPIRVIRHEHEERVVGVNTEASSSTSAELRRQAKDKDGDDGLFVSEGPVKPEPVDDDVPMADLPVVDDDEADDENPLPEQTAKARKTVTIKEPDPRGLLRTREDVEEFARHNEDLEMMREILALEQSKGLAENVGTGTDGASESKQATDEETIAAEKHAGKLFLIQFPPLTPNLVIPSKESDPITQPTTTKDEVKVEDDEEPSPNKLVTAVDQNLPAGRVGRLNLHKSGKVTLDWGGISFELDKGADVNFNQEALIASTSTTTTGTAAAETEQEDKQVWAMGELSGKFVASPEWSRLL